MYISNETKRNVKLGKLLMAYIDQLNDPWPDSREGLDNIIKELTNKFDKICEDYDEVL